MSYNLLAQSWIDVRTINGERKTVGILDLLKSAHTISDICTRPFHGKTFALYDYFVIRLVPWIIADAYHKDLDPEEILSAGQQDKTLCVQSDNPLDAVKAEAYGYTIVSETRIDDSLDDIKEGDTVQLTGKYVVPKDNKGSSVKQYDSAGNEDPYWKSWLEARAEESGFSILEYEGYGYDHIVFAKTKIYKAFYNASLVQIKAQVRDAAKFKRFIHKGLGRGKAYGCGLTIFQGN